MVKKIQRFLLVLIALAIAAPATVAGATDPEPIWAMMGTKIAMCPCADADVAVFPDGTVRMYYQEIGPQRTVVSLASKDLGVTWVKEPGVRATGAFPSLLQMPDGTWRMYLQTRIGVNEGIGYVTSTDGLTWSSPKSLMLPGGEAYQVDVVGGHSVLRLADGTFLMAYIGTKGTAGSLFWATSPDGDTWVKKGMVIDARSNIARNNVGIDGAELVQWDASTIRLYYRGFTAMEFLTYDQGSFVGPARNVIEFLTGKVVVVPGDPTLAYYGGRWHLFHGMGPRQDPAQPEEGIYEASYTAGLPTPTPTPSVTPTSTPTPTKVVKVISCVKGKQVKKVSGTNPKCPSGWKLKK